MQGNTYNGVIRQTNLPNQPWPRGPMHQDVPTAPAKSMNIYYTIEMVLITLIKAKPLIPTNARTYMQWTNRIKANKI